MSEYAGMVAMFQDPESARRAAERAHLEGFADFTLYLPHPDDSAIEAASPGERPVRFVALVGGLTGIGLALTMTILTSWDWPLVVGGKSITSWPPFLVICFEMMVLFGSLAAIAGALGFAHLPHVIPEPGYCPDLAIDTWGLFVPCSPQGLYHERVQKTLRELGATTVRGVYRG